MQPHDLMTLADRYTGHVGIKLSTVGAYSANDGKFFLRLGDGYDCRTKTAQKVADWFTIVSNGAVEYYQISAIVPPGHYYRATFTFSSWAELR